MDWTSLPERQRQAAREAQGLLDEQSEALATYDRNEIRGALSTLEQARDAVSATAFYEDKRSRVGKVGGK